MLRITGLLFFCALALSCDEVNGFFGDEKKKEISYSFSCLDSTLSARPISRNIDKASDILRDLAISKKINYRQFTDSIWKAVSSTND